MLDSFGFNIFDKINKIIKKSIFLFVINKVLSFSIFLVNYNNMTKFE